MAILFLIHAFLTWFMTGLCWFVQVVHYPLFRLIPEKERTTYSRKNYMTGAITIPVMSAELIYRFVAAFSAPGYVESGELPFDGGGRSKYLLVSGAGTPSARKPSRSRNGQ